MAPAVAKLLGDAPRVTAAGRMFPVEVRYAGSGLPLLPGGREEPLLAVLRAIKRALDRGRRATCWCSCPAPARSAACRACWRISAERRRVAAVSASSRQASRTPRSSRREPGRRKIVLATNIAETSLTIDGVRIVVDAGLERRSLFDPASGMNRLELQRISRASAEQRAGRAGRTAPGVCYRLWGEGAERSLAAYAPPEIVRFGSGAAGARPGGVGHGRRTSCAGWIRRPRPRWRARAICCSGSARSTPSGKVTPHGRAMQEFPAHPRLAHMLLKSRELGARGARRRARGAALGSRPAARRSGTRDSDVRTRLEALHGGGSGWIAARWSACAARSAAFEQ